MRNQKHNELLDWKLRGHVYLWMYNDGPKSVKARWQLTYDRAGEISFHNLISLFIEAEEGTRRTIALSHPRGCDFFPIDDRKWDFETWDKLVVERSKQDGIWLQKQERVVLLKLGGDGLLSFASQLKKVAPQNERSMGVICDGDKTGSLIIW